MNRPLRLLSVLFAVGAVATLVLGAAGFTTVEANRTVDVAVVDDDEAYLGIPDTVSCDDNNQAVVTNRFATSVDIKAEIAVPAEDEDSIRVNDREISDGETTEISEDAIGPGEAMRVDFKPKVVNNSTRAPDTITIGVVEARGDGIEATVDEREVDISC